MFVLFATLPEWIWPPQLPNPGTVPFWLPSPLPEVLLSAALWSLAHTLRAPLYNVISLVLPQVLDTILFNALHVFLSLFLRLAAIAILRVRHEMTFPRPTWHDGAFHTIWWLALGWALAEAITSAVQGYRQLALYRNVMVPLERVREILEQAKAQAHWGAGSMDGSREYMPLSPRSDRPVMAGESAAGAGADGSRRRAPLSVEDAIRMAVDQDVEQLINLQEREELEEVYGMPVIVSTPSTRFAYLGRSSRLTDTFGTQYIPVFVPCLQRVDSFLFSLGTTLVLAWAYLLSPLSFPAGVTPPPIYSSHALAIAFPVVFALHLLMALLHSPPVLPRIGVHTTAYVGLLVGLGGFFTGLGLWHALA